MDVRKCNERVMWWFTLCRKQVRKEEATLILRKFHSSTPFAFNWRTFHFSFWADKNLQHALNWRGKVNHLAFCFISQPSKQSRVIFSLLRKTWMIMTIVMLWEQTGRWRAAASGIGQVTHCGLSLHYVHSMRKYFIGQYSFQKMPC